MTKKIDGLFYSLPASLRRLLGRWWFEYISGLATGTGMMFINYGYASLSAAAEPPELWPEDEKNRYSIQLYHHLASNVDWHGSDALEVSCGRGGGASYIMRYFQPKSLVGVDITHAAIDFCNGHYSIEGLSFTRGDAESLRFADNSMDNIINVEASNNYPNVESFFRQVTRVLKPSGYFLYADLREKDGIDAWHRQLEKTGMELVEQTVISDNVVRALELDNGRKQKLIREHLPRIFHGIAKEFAGIHGSNSVYNSLKTGEKVYESFVFRKPDGSTM